VNVKQMKKEMQLHKGPQRIRKVLQRNLWTYVFIIPFIFYSTQIFSQQKKLKTVEVSDTIAYAYVDRPGDLYVITLGGQLQRFDKDGRLSNLYRKGPALSLFDPRDGARLFAYYRDKAQYDFLNPSFDVVSSYKIDSAFALNPWMVCTSGDYNVWVLDGSDWSLKKIDMRTGTIPVEVVLSVPAGKARTDIISMREYQNFVFVLDKKEGIMIYSSMGKYLRTLPVAKPRYFNFIGEEVYYLVGDKLKFMDLFTTETRELKLPVPADLALLTDERLFVIRKNVIDIFEVK
jgi:hypothetical protein